MKLKNIIISDFEKAPNLIKNLYLRIQQRVPVTTDLLEEAEEKHPRYFENTIYDKIPVPIYRYAQLQFWRAWFQCLGNKPKEIVDYEVNNSMKIV